MLKTSTIADPAQSHKMFTGQSSLFKRARSFLALSCVLAVTACGGTTGTTISGPNTSLPAPPPSSYPAQNPQTASLPPELSEPELPDIDVIQTTRIGVLVPMTGVASNAGLGLRNAAVLAQFQVNNPGLILQFYDTKGTPEGAQAAATQAINQGATLLVGPLFASSVQAVTPVAQTYGVPVLSFSTNPTVVSQNVYVTGFLIQPQIERIVSYAIESGQQDFAILSPETAYGAAAAFAAHQSILEHGGNVIRSATFDPSQVNFSDVIRGLSMFDERKKNLEEEIAKLDGKEDPASKAALERLEQLDTLGDVDFDTLILPVAGSTLHRVANLLKYYDVDTTQVKLLGTLLWQDEELGKESALRGAWYPAASRVGYDQFVENYTQTYGYKPSQLTSLAYDMITLAAALPQHSDTPWALLTAPGGFIGVNGAFRMEYNGLVQRMMAVREVEANGSRVISPAPTRFTALDESPFENE